MDARAKKNKKQKKTAGFGTTAAAASQGWKTNVAWGPAGTLMVEKNVFRSGCECQRLKIVVADTLKKIPLKKVYLK